MSDELATEPQAIAAETVETVEQATPANREEASAQLSMARMTHAPAKEISRLEAFLNPPAEPEAEVETETAAEVETRDEPEPEPAGDTPQDEDGEFKVTNRPRLTHLSEPDKHDMALIVGFTRKGMSLAEATQRVLGDIGSTQQTIPGADTQTDAPPEIVPEVAAVQAEIDTAKARLAEIKAERNRLAENADLYGPEAAALDNAQTDVLEQLAEARANLAEAKANAQQASIHQQTSLQAVAKDYPDAVKQGTALFRMTAGIAAEIRGDPNHPDHALVGTDRFLRHCTEAAAKELGASRSAPSQSNRPAAAPQVKQPGPASGSRASTPALPAKSAAELAAESAAHTQAVLEGRAPARSRLNRMFIAR